MAGAAMRLLACIAALLCLWTAGSSSRLPEQFVVSETEGLAENNILENKEGSIASPKPSTARADIEAALVDLSQAACPGNVYKLLSLIGDNITVLAPGIEPLTLYSGYEAIQFFSTSFLPCGVNFVLADLIVGNGALIPQPWPAKGDAASKKSSLTDGKNSFVVSRLVFSDLKTGTTGKALALWTLAGKRKVPKGSPINEDHYHYNLTVIGWNFDAPASIQQGAQSEHRSLESVLLEEAKKNKGKRSAGLHSSKVNVWAALDQSIAYFTGNLSIGDVNSASLFFSSSQPFYYLQDALPTVVVTNPVQKLAFTQSLMGPTYTYTNLQVWKVKVIDSEVTAEVGKTTLADAFTITKVEALIDGKVVSGNTLRLWEAEIVLVNPEPAFPGAKVVQYANRWVLFAPSTLPAPPSNVPSPASADPDSPSKTPEAPSEIPNVPSPEEQVGGHFSA